MNGDTQGVNNFLHIHVDLKAGLPFGGPFLLYRQYSCFCCVNEQHERDQRKPTGIAGNKYR